PGGKPQFPRGKPQPPQAPQAPGGQPQPPQQPPAPGGQPQQPAAGQVLNAADLVKEYQQNRQAAEKKNNGKTLTIQGPLRQGDFDGALVLETNLPSILPGANPGVTDVVIPRFRNPADLAAVPVGTTIVVQGQCTGFNEELDVVLINCQLLRR